MYAGPAAAVLGQLSKAALIDMVLEAVANANGYVVEATPEVTPAEVRKFVEPVLLARGDRVPR